MSILDNISSPNAIKIVKKDLLPNLAQEVRQEIIETTSKTGGHLASSLGVVDLTIALHYVFDVEKDKFIAFKGNKINIIDYGMHRATMSMIAKKLIKTYNFEMVVFTIGSPTGNVWFFTKHSLGLV